MNELHELNRSIGALTASMAAAQEQDREQFALLREMSTNMAALKGALDRHMAVEEQRDADVEQRLRHVEEAMSEYRNLKAKAGGVIAVAAFIAAGIGAVLIEAIKHWWIK